MKRLQSRKDLSGYTMMRQVLINLDIINKDYMWLITDIEAYPSNEKLNNLISNNDYLLLTTKELVDILNEEDFQWIWAVFSAIPSSYSKEEILKYDLPFIQPISKKYDPFGGNPKVQHPLAVFEIGAWDSSGMFLVTDDENILAKFKKSYPLAKEDFYDNKKVVIATKPSKDTYFYLLMFISFFIGMLCLFIYGLAVQLKEAILLASFLGPIFLIMTIVMVRVIYISKELITIENNKLVFRKEFFTNRIDIFNIKKIDISKFGKEAVTRIFIETETKNDVFYYRFSEKEFERLKQLNDLLKK